MTIMDYGITLIILKAHSNDYSVIRMNILFSFILQSYLIEFPLIRICTRHIGWYRINFSSEWDMLFIRMNDLFSVFLHQNIHAKFLIRMRPLIHPNETWFEYGDHNGLIWMTAAVVHSNENLLFLSASAQTLPSFLSSLHTLRSP